MTSLRKFHLWGLAFYVLACLWLPVACDPEPVEQKRNYSENRKPCREYHPSKKAYFGDLHVHTAHSFDAWAYQTRVTPAQA